jgi:hypothetical protein
LVVLSNTREGSAHTVYYFFDEENTYVVNVVCAVVYDRFPHFDSSQHSLCVGTLYIQCAYCGQESLLTKKHEKNVVCFKQACVYSSNSSSSGTASRGN